MEVGVDSFVTLAEADAYHASRLSAGRWLALGDLREPALVSAYTAIIAYESPSSGLDHSNAPGNIKAAQTEYALLLGEGAVTAAPQKTLKAFTPETGKVEYFESGKEEAWLPPLIEQLLKSGGYFFNNQMRFYVI